MRKRISLSVYWICQQMFCSPKSIQVILNCIKKDHSTFESIVFSLLLIQKIGKLLKRLFQTLDSRFCEKWHVTLLWSNSKNVRLIMGSLSGFWSRLNQWKNSSVATFRLLLLSYGWKWFSPKSWLLVVANEYVDTGQRGLRGSINKHIH